MFPPEWPGMGGVPASFCRGGIPLPGWLRGATVLVSIPPFAGFLTPIAAALGLLLHGAIWLGFGASSPAAANIVPLDVVALALLGPGGYSVDALRFGRRVVVLPPT